MHTVAVLALDGLIPFDLATPIEVFSRARLPGGGPAYRVRVCAPTPMIEAGLFRLHAPWGLDALTQADTVVVPGRADPAAPVPDVVLEALRQAAAGGTRLASICVGSDRSPQTLPPLLPRLLGFILPLGLAAWNLWKFRCRQP